MRVVYYFQEGLMQYRRQCWDEASDAFTAALDLHAGDELSRLYIQRCQYLKEHPPGPDWTGVWVMESK
jgi:adenylate cyclase